MDRTLESKVINIFGGPKSGVYVCSMGLIASLVINGRARYDESDGIEGFIVNDWYAHGEYRIESFSQTFSIDDRDIREGINIFILRTELNPCSEEEAAIDSELLAMLDRYKIEIHTLTFDKTIIERIECIMEAKGWLDQK